MSVEDEDLKQPNQKHDEKTEPPQKTPNPLDVQIGGRHYKNLKIQPVEFIHANKLPFLDGCIIKRICRFRSKNGKEDLLKARHEIDLLIAMEYGEPD